MILSKGLPAEVDFEEDYAMIYDNNDEGFHCLMNVYMNEDCIVTEIFVPDCVKYIAPNAFANCSKLVSIARPSSIYGIGANAFDGYAALQNLAIPDTVQYIAPTALGNSTVIPCVTPGSPAEAWAIENGIQYTTD